MKITKLLLGLLLLITNVKASPKEKDDTTTSTLNQEQITYIKLLDSMNRVLKFDSGMIKLENGIATLNVPKGFKFINKEQANYIITKLWGNPTQNGVLGLLVPNNSSVLIGAGYAFVVSYDPMGYVKDDDAGKINYDDLLKEIKKDEQKENEERLSLGFSSMNIVGWAQKPFYDSKRKILHWAKEFEINNDTANHSLNYDIRILGRKGILSLNAVGSMKDLEDVNKDIESVLAMAQFTEGNKYENFDSSIDEVAAWTIGGLVAGKVLAKAGILALLLKNIKLIAIGAIALFGTIWKKITGRKRKEEEEQVTASNSNENAIEENNTDNQETTSEPKNLG
ncbi:MAG: DUF2167 domain-containing protein [Chitinophagaceae bacterium]